MLWLIQKLFKRAIPKEPPTAKQLRFAARLGVNVTQSMGKRELSAAIGEALERKAKKKKFGGDAVQAEEDWNRFAEDVGYMLAVYREGKGLVVDVLLLSGSFLDSRRGLMLSLESPRIIKDKHIGDYLEWDEGFDLPSAYLVYYEPLNPEFYREEYEAYQRVVKRGLKIARKL